MARKRKWYSVNGLEVLAILGILFVLVLLLLTPATHGYEVAQRVHCQDNFKRLGMAFRIYAREDPRERLPRMHGYETFGALSNAPGCTNIYDDFDFGPDMRSLYPEYVSDLLILVCPSGPYSTKPTQLLGPLRIGSLGYTNDAVDATGIVHDDGSGACRYAELMTNGDVSYTYLPWVAGDEIPGFHDAPNIDETTALRAGLTLEGPAPLVAFAQWIRQAQSLEPAASASLLDSDIDLAEVFAGLDEHYVHSGCETGRGRQTVLRRLSSHVERDLLEPPVSYLGPPLPTRATIPVLFDRVFAAPDAFDHLPGGSNVLYLDGHVEFVKYPQRFPVSQAWERTMSLLRN